MTVAVRRNTNKSSDPLGTLMQGIQTAKTAKDLSEGSPTKMLDSDEKSGGLGIGGGMGGEATSGMPGNSGTNQSSAMQRLQERRQARQGVYS